MPADAAPGRARPLGGESEALEQPVPRDSRSSEGPKAAIRSEEDGFIAFQGIPHALHRAGQIL